MKVFVFLATGFEEIEAISIIDVLRRANINTVTVSTINERKVVGAHNIPVVADELFYEVDFLQGDMLVLPGGMPGSSNLEAHQGLNRLILEYHKQGKYIAAICAAPLVFGELGLLKGENATCFPGYEDRLKGACKLNERVVVSGKIITGKAAGTAIEFGLKLVEILNGKELADNLSSSMFVIKE